MHLLVINNIYIEIYSKFKTTSVKEYQLLPFAIYAHSALTSFQITVN